ncbi:unnamed protein product [Ambrosiozyma monospora]|uniref:Unnamed protein product n=1 Tax=Ambrosiozyma monospora TaxID=43982 RepID=A0A9W6YY43_AMBMO|nr:unnamed protein product [Ambrosiozyma monospora]
MEKPKLYRIPSRKRSSSRSRRFSTHHTTTSSTNLTATSTTSTTTNPTRKSRSRSRSRTRSRRRHSSTSTSTTGLKSQEWYTSFSSTTSSSKNDSAIDDSTPASAAAPVYKLNEVKANLDNTLPSDYFKQDILSVLTALRIPKWRKIQPTKENISLVTLERISGAMTNSIYKVSYKNYYPLLLRMYGDNLDDIIDRENELLMLHRLSLQNIGPKLLGCFTNGRFEEFLNNSITLNKEQIKDKRISRMIARRMKELHFGIPLLSEEKLKGPKTWSLIEKWVDVIDKFAQNCSQEEQKVYLIVEWNKLKKWIFKYRDWLFDKYGGRINVDEMLMFCHNDTQYGNLLFYNKLDQLSMEEDDDPIQLQKQEQQQESSQNSQQDRINEKLEKLHLSNTPTTKTTQNISVPIETDLNYEHDKKLVVIDFEYAGPNIPAYDITNHFSEWMYDYHHPETPHHLFTEK